MCVIIVFSLFTVTTQSDLVIRAASFKNSANLITTGSSIPGPIVNGTLQLPRDSYKDIPFLIENTSYLVYATKSNESISTAVMNSQQFQNFNHTGGSISDSAFDQNGTTNLNAILLTQGLYYLTLFANSQAANIDYSYDLVSNIPIENSTTSVSGFLTVSPFSNLSTWVHLQTLGSPSTIQLLGISNQTVSFSLYDNTTQNTVFSSGAHQTVTNLTFSAQGQMSLGLNLSLSQGLYNLTLINNESTPAFVYAHYSIVPAYVNPYIVELANLLPPAPTGIAAYGLYNNSGQISTYIAEGSSVVGYANITSMNAFNSNNLTDNWANLQMNAVLRVRNSNNSTDEYWPQNAMWFSTGLFPSDRQVYYRNNVLNLTGDNATMTNATIQGTGFVSGNSSIGWYYGNYNTTYFYGYAFPWAFVLYMNETVQPGQGVWVYTGVQTLENGTTPVSNTSIVWYDKIFIVDPNATSASFVVSGKDYTPVGANMPIGAFYDTELVFGGDLNGMSAYYTSMSAVLSLFYYNQTLKTYPSVYPFATNTAESTYNLQATYNGNGVTLSITANPTYGILTNNYSSSLVSLETGKAAPAATTTSSGELSSTSQERSSSSTSSLTSVSTSQAAVTSSSSGNSSSSAFPSFGVGAIIVIVVILLGIVGVMAARRGRSEESSARYESRSDRNYSESSRRRRVPETVNCPQCGAQNPSRNTHCANCGRKLPRSED